MGKHEEDSSSLELGQVTGCCEHSQKLFRF